ncbi:sulfite reductase subunit alpha [Stutzerimonas sp. VN223-3]|uniref:sulfite reductase subunit alpha n=1 Tax=Stutzerimonas sp. VN223-3 TaxID=3384601 RepID=UPI0038B5D770
MHSSKLVRHMPSLACLSLATLLFWWQPARELSATLVAMAYLGVCLHLWQHHRQAVPPHETTSSALLIAYASQGGQARELAERSADQLRGAGVATSVLPLNGLSPEALHDHRRVLFIVSTYGEGEAPENAARFERQLLNQARDLSHLEYAVLALGDRQYNHFCGFGRRLDTRLRELGALPLFDRLEADRGDAGVLRHWQQQLAHVGGNSDFSDWQPAPYQRWRLDLRECLNPGSQGAPAFHLGLSAGDGRHNWRAGDIAEVGPRHSLAEMDALLRRLGHDPQASIDQLTLADALSTRRLPDDEAALLGLDIDGLLALPLLPHREYSIASVPADGQLQLLVREARHADGSLGIGSGWLCRHSAIGNELDLRVRSNPGFHGPAADTPMILIGNGTGLAGLRAHLRERAGTPASMNWLVFGERSAQHDQFFRDELQAWLISGHLQRLDLAFSRDQPGKIYVQHLLRDAADELRRWIDEGAALYICGSLEGMGREVQQILAGVLGDQQLQQLTEQGRYKRDLY